MKRRRSAASRTVTGLAILALVLTIFPLGVTSPRAVAATVAPILLIHDPAGSNPFGAYLGEILSAEGVRDVETRTLAELSSALLTGRRAVVLAELTPSAAQVSALDAFVSGGGGLVAMRPAASLNTILGVGADSGTTVDGYMRITDATQGAGLYGDTMQFHGGASHYTLSGATQVAQLYSDRSTATSRPAATLATYGAGKAAMFAYDLAQSVALTRQGNPANTDTDTDGDGVVRTIDMFRNWSDLERSRVPQADVQQRLFARLLAAVTAQPTPRVWFFPSGAPTVIVATADAHANPDSYYQTEVDALLASGQPATFYLSPAGNPSAALVNNWRSQGFDFGPHPYVDCGYACGMTNAFDWFTSTYGFNPRTVRTHQVRWAGWTSAATIEAQHGVQMDFNFYQWGSWLTNSSGPAIGYLGGSGQPMRFVDASGAILPIYQQHTNLVDEFLAPGVGVANLTLDQAMAASRATIDDSVGGYHTPIATQYHVDYFYPDVSTWGMGTTDYAIQQGAIPMHSDTWLTFVQQRAATTIAGSNWANDELTFNVSAGGPNQTMLLPAQFGGSALSSLRIGGAAASFSTKVVNGVTYAEIPASTATYIATYTPDTTAPTIASTSPTSGATNVALTSPVSVAFSEAMDRASAQAAFSISPAVTGAFSWNSAGTTMTFAPSAQLASSTSYTASVSTGARDLSGNALASATTWSFTTAVVTPPPAVTAISPISGPVAGGTSVTITGTDFTGATSVSFGGTAATSFTVNSPTSITATSPARSAGIVDIIVTTAAGTSAASSASKFTYVDASSTLTAQSVDPGTGSASGGASVAITGSGFASGATVTFGGVAATNVVVVNTTRITATTPAHAAGVVDVVVTNSDNKSSTLGGGYTFVACPGSCVTHTTSASFAKGVMGAGATINETTDGEVSLAPAAGSEFSGNALPAGWTATPWTSGGAATVGGGAVSVDASLLATNQYYSPGRSVEFVATFAAAPNQHAGLGIDLNNNPWAIFSTGSSGGALYARTNGNAATDTQIAGSWLGAPHRFRIDWTTTSVVFSIDGTEVATHTVTINSDMRPVASDGPLGGSALALDWLRLTPYAANGSYDSRVFDSGGSATWGTLTWSATAPVGTSLDVSARTGNTPTPDGTWTAFTTLSGSGATIGGTSRYLQYRVNLATTDPAQASALRDVTIAYTVSGPLSPAIDAISPDSGTTNGGTSVTINGANFAAGATVTIGSAAATAVTIVSATSITATTAAHAAGVVDVTVTNPDNGSGTLPGGYVYIAPPPTVTAISPTSGSTAGGTTVTITGTNFVGVTGVSFGGVPASGFIVDSATSVRATAPSRAEGAVSVTVTTPGGTSASSAADTFTYLTMAPAPVVATIDPGAGPTSGGAAITINGANFAAGATVSVGGATATDVVVVSSGRVTATVPAGTAGAANVVVSNPDGQSATVSGGYRYLDCAVVCASDTTQANFSAGTGDAGIYLAKTADGEVSLAPSIGAEFEGVTLPAGWTATPWTSGGAATVGGGAVSVNASLLTTDIYNGSGRALEFAGTFRSGLPYQHAGFGTDLNNTPWAIFSTGADGSALYARTNAGSTFQTTQLTGSWLGAPHRFRVEWLSTQVIYSIDGSVVATHDIVINQNMRPVFSDAAAGDGDLVIEWARVDPWTAGGTFVSRVLDAGTEQAWRSLTWTGDAPSGTILTVSARTGNTAAPDATWSAFAALTGPTATISGNARYIQYQVELTTTVAGRTPTLRDVTAVGASATPAISSIAPTSGPTVGGTSVVITGTNFTGTTGVAFGGIAATSFSVTSDTSITATTPARLAGAVDVVVTALGGTGTATGGFTYVPPPSISSITPAAGSTLGGTAVAISGADFVAGASVTFNGSAATGVSVVNATTITATTPAQAAGTVNVVVTNPDGQSATLVSGYTYVAPPSLVSISPTSGPTAGGTAVTIAGADFTSGATVTIGGVAATGIVVVDMTTITATTSASAAGTVDVVVTNPDGQSGTLAAAYTYVAPVTAGAAAPTSIQDPPQKGSIVSGGLADLGADDGSYLAVAASGKGKNQQVDFYAEYVVPTTQRNLVGLTVSYDGGASVTGFDRTISLFNFATNNWDTLATTAQTTADLRTTVTISGDPKPYMSSTGAIRMRARANHNAPFRLNVDEMTFVVTYQP